MIILDTHIWIWWVNSSSRLADLHRSYINQHQPDGLGISLISCWEVAKAVESGRLGLSLPVQDWLESATAYPGVQRLDLTIPIIIESTKLTGFHRDPGDQLIVATSRILQSPLLTADFAIGDIVGYFSIIAIAAFISFRGYNDSSNR